MYVDMIARAKNKNKLSILKPIKRIVKTNLTVQS